MSDIEDLVKAQASDAVRKRNPEFFSKSPMNYQMKEVIITSQNTHKNLSKPLSKRNNLVSKFLMTWTLCKGPKLIKEFKFHPERKFRSDFCHIETRTCIEIEGGIFNKKGGHSSISGILRDISKYNEMVYLGFRVVRFHVKSINVPEIVRLIKFLESRKFVDFKTPPSTFNPN